MTPLTLGELHTIAYDLQALVGSQLQDVWMFEDHIALGFYHERSVQWLWFELDARAPQVVWLEAIPSWAKKKITKPLILFIKANVEGQRLAVVEVPHDQGKVLLLKFLYAVIEVRLFVGGVNLIVRANEKAVSFDKIRELVQHEESREPGRSFERMTQEWREEKAPVQRLKKSDSSAASSPVVAAEKQWQKDLDKKQNALEKMGVDLAAKENPIWRQAGAWLKGEGLQDFPHALPEHFLEIIDRKKSLSENIEALFKKAKDAERKQEGSRERMAMLQAEISKMKERGPQAASGKNVPKRQASLLAKAEARGRQMRVADDLDAYIGKAAADNLALLRKAQPFDYWLHLRDYPGTHAILRRARTRLVKDSEFAQVGAWVAQQSLGKTADELKGLKLDVLIVECRYVRPIKGDKLGRVHYTHDRVLTCRL